jgi:hypothetical protein
MIYDVYFIDGTHCELECNHWEDEERYIERIVKSYHAVKVIRKSDGVIVYEPPAD